MRHVVMTQGSWKGKGSKTQPACRLARGECNGTWSLVRSSGPQRAQLLHMPILSPLGLTVI